jgi:ABC-2 type transport system permease protein
MIPALHVRWTPRTSAFKKLVLVEAKLLLREPIPFFWGVAVPMILLTVFGVFATGPHADVGGIRLVAVYEPILIAFVTATFAVQGLPTVLASYRERGILRRLDATPVGARRVLAAELTVNLGVALTATAGILVLGRLAFGVALPRQVAGFLLTIVLTSAAMLALGLLIGAVAPTGRTAGAVGAILFLPMMFFAGLWTPRATMPPVLRHISDFTPLGAAVGALTRSMSGQWPHPSGLAALAAYALVFGAVAVRFFRWD